MKFDKKPLVPLVVLRVARIKHAIPIERACISAHRRFLDCNVFVGPITGIGVALDGRVFSRQTKSIPTNWVHDIESLLDPVTSDYIAECISLCMAHMKVARWIGKHVQDILLGARIICAAGFKWLEFVPDWKPLLLNVGKIICRMFLRFCGHWPILTYRTANKFLWR